MKPSRCRSIGIVFLCVLLGIGSYLLVKYFSPFELEPWQVKRKILQIFYYPAIGRFKYGVGTALLWVGLVLTLTLERLLPAESNQKILSLSFAQDFVWFFYEGILQALIIATYVSLLKWGYEHYCSGLTITYVNHYPGWTKFLFVVLLLDLLMWLQHYLNHKVPLLWEFHKIHHSQQKLNFFTDFRYHVLEYIVRQTVVVIPFLILNVDRPKTVVFVFLHSWYTRFYHGNIRTNLGPLRYILVTPQSHRVHHSPEKRHCDTNFASLFCVWDFLFHTQYKGFDEYPAAGINDPAFPQEKSGSLKNLLITPFRQMRYPFWAIQNRLSTLVL
jgi:sterol desaturase/sphingolipid hydroxylase (fatty acid hydroxylase superfamily)